MEVQTNNFFSAAAISVKGLRLSCSSFSEADLRQLSSSLLCNLLFILICFIVQSWVLRFRGIINKLRTRNTNQVQTQ